MSAYVSPVLLHDEDDRYSAILEEIERLQILYDVLMTIRNNLLSTM